ncbi:MAG: (E)-4-hydroxy-3-methylbut-2-enyl-diphosphate synthase [Prevotellaceae bacterium]|jgi:(E)-4-hydroxy-3-methylbut-2-enyl-diphosphate synthase|nr:(E)-4-hydroxy-3-methylbut-2-enyl-diphosphate synthase [Prevotellaceae bacterium]
MKFDEVHIGNIPLGGAHPIRLQSMTTTNTLDVPATVTQCIAIAKAGADYVRITAQGVREAEALQQVKAALKKQGYNIPLIADIHFNPAAAEVAAQYVEKVRINPGNFVDRADGTDEPALLREKFVRLLGICRAHGTALRVGVNHGSLSARMVGKYGDTPQGMVESAMEFLRICRDENFDEVVVSMKSSNTRVMVYATRLLAHCMKEEGMSYPLHLGVTEAGEGEDGRIKSAVGIGALLADRLGSTIRVSLTEEPQREIPVAKKLVQYFSAKTTRRPQRGEAVAHNLFSYAKRKSTPAIVAPVGGNNPVAVAADLSRQKRVTRRDVEQLGFTFDGQAWKGSDVTPDVIYVGMSEVDDFPLQNLHILSDEDENLLHCTVDFPDEGFFDFLKYNPKMLLVLALKNGVRQLDEQRKFFAALKKNGVANAVLLHRTYSEADYESLQLQAAADFGSLLIDGLGDGIMLSLKRPSNITETVASVKAEQRGATLEAVEQTATFTRSARASDLVGTSFNILQAARVRFSKTEYIACPGCGRTLFDLQKTLQEVKARTSHLKGLKIAVMGCIVNGPGEMADADYGYVGAGAGRVSLYRGKVRVAAGVDCEHAVDKLVALIKESGDWR